MKIDEWHLIMSAVFSGIALAVVYLFPWLLWLPAVLIGPVWYYGWEAGDHEWSVDKNGFPSRVRDSLGGSPRMLTEPMPPPFWRWPMSHQWDLYSAVIGGLLAGAVYWVLR